MKYFFSCLLFSCQVDDDADLSPMQEESIRLIAAHDDADALRKSEDLGKSSEHSYQNDDGATVFWRFAKVIDVQEFCEEGFSDGVEVYSRLYRKPANQD